jgi:hypothetical protein
VGLFLIAGPNSRGGFITRPYTVCVAGTGSRRPYMSVCCVV